MVTVITIDCVHTDGGGALTIHRNAAAPQTTHARHQQVTGLPFRECDNIEVAAAAATDDGIWELENGIVLPFADVSCVRLSAFIFEYFIEYLLDFLHDKSHAITGPISRCKFSN